MRDWAVWQAGAGCYSQAVMSSNDSKTLYREADSKRTGKRAKKKDRLAPMAVAQQL